MTEPRADLKGRTILIVEDEYLLASELDRELKRSGATVIGPVASVETASAALALQRPDAAVIDINLRSVPVFSFADELMAAKVPFVFATGYDARLLPARFLGVPCHEKPAALAQLVRSLERLISRPTSLSVSN